MKTDKKVSIHALTKMFINNEKNIGFVNNDRLMKVATRMKADTSIAECLHGKGFIADALFEAIEKRIAEINSSKN